MAYMSEIKILLVLLTYHQFCLTATFQGESVSAESPLGLSPLPFLEETYEA